MDIVSLIAQLERPNASKALKQYAAEGGDLNANAPDGNPLLHRLLTGDHPELIKLAVELGADVNRKDAQGWTALHAAVDLEIDAAIQADQPEVQFADTRALIEAGADEHARNAQGQRPRDIAADYGGNALRQYDAISRVRWEEEPSFEGFAINCQRLLAGAGYDVRVVDPFRLSLSRDAAGHDKPGGHFFIAVPELHRKRQRPDLQEHLLRLVRNGFDRLDELAGE